MPFYKVLDHTADIRLQFWGRTRRQLLQNAAYALTDTLAEVRRVKPSRTRRVRLRGSSFEHLLVLLLKEILYLFDAKQFLTGRLVTRRLDDTILEADLRGETVKDHNLKTEIKAVTYHGLKVEKKRGRWLAEVVFDV